MDAADYNVVVSEHRRESINAIGIAFLRDNAVELRHSLWMPHDGCDLVTPLCKLGKNSRSGIACGTDQRNPHRLPPAGDVTHRWAAQQCLIRMVRAWGKALLLHLVKRR